VDHEEEAEKIRMLEEVEDVEEDSLKEGALEEGALEEGALEEGDDKSFLIFYIIILLNLLKIDIFFNY
jgi:hypothetical protein